MDQDPDQNPDLDPDSNPVSDPDTDPDHMKCCVLAILFYCTIVLKMRFKISPFLWLLFPLLLLRRSDSGAFAIVYGNQDYDHQVIAILKDDPAILKAAQYLYQKHDTTSHLVKWNENTGIFDNVAIVRNENGLSYETLPDQEPLPIEWSATKVQVIGHGDIREVPATIGGFSAEQLAETLVMQQNKEIPKVKKISIVGCTKEGESGTKTPVYLYDFLNKMKQLVGKETSPMEVSIRSDLVSIDQSGRKLTGELLIFKFKSKKFEVGIKWSYKNLYKKWTSEFTGRDYTVPKRSATETGGKSRFFGILPANSDLYVSASKKNVQVHTRCLMLVPLTGLTELRKKNSMI